MNCREVQEWLAAYWDLPEQDATRREIDEHIRGCAACREEFDIWRESAELIRDTVDKMERPITTIEPVTNQVMKRIYASESWRMPVTDRIYSISYTMRRNLTAIIAFCITLFVFGLLLSVFHDPGASTEAAGGSLYGLKPVASASSDVHTISVKSKQLSTATASIREPYMLQMGPIRSYPDYMVVLSLLGLTGTLLIMNWLSRTKA